MADAIGVKRWPRPASTPKIKVRRAATDVVVSNERLTSELRPSINPTKTTAPASETTAVAWK
jgi:hypothetical protein